MKKRNLLILISAIILTGFFFTACEDEPADTNRPLMTALVEGSTWRSPEPNARVSDNQIIVYGTSADGQSIQITVYDGEKGVYTLNAANLHEGTLTPNTSSYAEIYSTSNHSDGSGQVRISSINEDDRTISGSFNFRAYKQDGGYKNVTNGEFTKVPYKYINTSDTTSVVNVLTAIVDGDDFTAANISAADSSDIIHITGSLDEAFESITLEIPNTLGGGAHSIDPNNGPVMAFYQEGLSNYPAVAGSTTISEHDTENNIIKGSFFFNVEDNDDQTIEISGGYFEVQY
ncbi:MAG TPA: DUF6252 family protein [Bacteroidales bacterium]|nr:DUF6252 family protein [Bacteroidales bacterium]